MLLEEARFLSEDLERLEQAISDRLLENPRNKRDTLSRDHRIAGFLSRSEELSQKLANIFEDDDGDLENELQSAAAGDAFENFNMQLKTVKDFHRRYPNEPVENLERAYKVKIMDQAENMTFSSEIDSMFSGEEAYGRFFDLTGLHEQYLNLPGVRGGRRLNYLQYLDLFDAFAPPQCLIKRSDKLKDGYFKYVDGLAYYLESFLKRSRPLEALEQLFQNFEAQFEEAWIADAIQEWSTANLSMPSSIIETQGTGEGIWCQYCEKEFKNDNVYQNHLNGKKHLRAVEAKGPNALAVNEHAISMNGSQSSTGVRLKEKAVAEREFRVRKLAAAMQTERADTKVNVERRQGMTERERQQELDAFYADAADSTQNQEKGSDEEEEDKIYNPLKLPLDWSGKPIPYWLYKLHGLGVEFNCEICGNYVYHGRRAFDKHFNEARHIHGLKCLGITNTSLFREITSIDEAQKLWNKLQEDKKKEKSSSSNIVEMEDSSGNIMPEKVYNDLQKQGLI